MIIKLHLSFFFLSEMTESVAMAEYDQMVTEGI